jgi:Ribosomal protein L11 methyltransferase (PrmA)
MTIIGEQDDGLNKLDWQSLNKVSPPKQIVFGDDQLSADKAYHLACQGTGILWQGDFQNARQLLQAINRRLSRKKNLSTTPIHQDLKQIFHLHRLAQSQRARTLGMILISVDEGYRIPLKRAPDIGQACEEVFGPFKTPFLISLKDIQALIGAHEWRKKGLYISSLEARIHPHFGVFSPTRGEYIDLIMRAPIPSLESAIDVGTGTGVMTIALIKRGVKQVIATDTSPQAIACAQENFKRLKIDNQVILENCHLFPARKSGLVVCNPPWIPSKPSSSLEQAIYDPENQMLLGFLQGVKAHLTEEGEAWLIMSNLAELLQLRKPGILSEWIHSFDLTVIDKIDTRPTHAKVMDSNDRFHALRQQEITSLWRMKAKSN